MATSSKPRMPRKSNEAGTQLQLSLAPAPTLGDVPIAVQLVDRRMRSAWKGVVGLGRTETVFLPRPGHYSVQAILPSGLVVARNVHVTADGAGTVELDVLASRSVLKLGKKIARAEFASSAPPNATKGGENAPNLPAGLAWSRISRSKRFVAASADTASRALNSTWLRLWREGEDGSWGLVPWLGGEVSRAGDIAQFELRLGAAPAQYYLQTGGEDLPWRLTALPADDLRITLRGEWKPAVSGDGFPTPLTGPRRRVSVDAVTLDAKAETLLAYLASGQFDVARDISDRLIAESLLERKRQNPTVAAIAGYYLLSTGKLEEVHQIWAANLADRWTWLPDGAVIDAWYLMRLPNPDLERARSRLIEAVARGLPVYTRGLRLLLDGLAAFEDDPDFASPDIGQALRIVRRYCRSVDWSSLTASFLGPDPATPDRQETGRPESRQHLVFIEPTAGDEAWSAANLRRAATGMRSTSNDPASATPRMTIGSSPPAGVAASPPTRAVAAPRPNSPGTTEPSFAGEGAAIASRDVIARLFRAVDRQTQSEQVASSTSIAVDVGDAKPARLRGVALERILGRSELLSPLFLQRGLAASRTVGRVVTCSADGLPTSMSTGFLVSPSLLLTAAHVLPNTMAAQRSYVEFDYEDGPDGVLRRPSLVELDPRAFFVSDEEADFTMIALKDKEIGRRQGWCRLLGDEIKALTGERLSVVQHALGAPKQFALRELEIVEIGETFFHCSARIAASSSGAPLFNDQWEVVGFCRAQSLQPSTAPDADPGGTTDHRSTNTQRDRRIFEAVRISRVLKVVNRLDHSADELGLREELLHSGTG